MLNGKHRLRHLHKGYHLCSKLSFSSLLPSHKYVFVPGSDCYQTAYYFTISWIHFWSAVWVIILATTVQGYCFQCMLLCWHRYWCDVESLPTSWVRSKNNFIDSTRLVPIKLLLSMAAESLANNRLCGQQLFNIFIVLTRDFERGHRRITWWWSLFKCPASPLTVIDRIRDVHNQRHLTTLLSKEDKGTGEMYATSY